MLWRVTHNPQYRAWGWDLARSLERHARVAGGGYASLDSVLADSPHKRDKMESFFLAETLKYLLLLFSDDPGAVPLDRFVFNTEAHPLPVVGAGGRRALAQALRLRGAAAAAAMAVVAGGTGETVGAGGTQSGHHAVDATTAS